MNELMIRNLIKAIQHLENQFFSHVDGRDYMEEMRPGHWHYCDIKVRQDGQDHIYEGDWLKNVNKARKSVRAILTGIDPVDLEKWLHKVEHDRRVADHSRRLNLRVVDPQPVQIWEGQGDCTSELHLQKVPAGTSGTSEAYWAEKAEKENLTQPESSRI